MARTTSIRTHLEPDVLYAITATADVYQRTLSSEVRLAILGYLRRHALWLVDHRPEAIRAELGDDADLDEVRADLERSLVEFENRTFKALPATTAIALAAALDDA